MAQFGKRFFALLLSAAVILLAMPTAWAAEKITVRATDTVAYGDCGDNLTWVLDAEGVLTISGTGAMDDWSSTTDIPWYDYRESVVSIIMEDGVTSIGNAAFSGGFFSLTSVSIPDTVTTIGHNAFQACTALTEITIPASVTSVGRSTFYNCSALTRVTFEGNTPSLAAYVFGNTASTSAVEFIVFKGDTPSSFISNCFMGVTAVAYYPQNNETWTETLMQDYGGAITWTAYDPVEPSEISIQLETSQMAVFDTQQLSVDWSGAYIQPIQWSSSDSEVVSVTTDSGLITAWKAGSATISCTVYNGLTASVTITVAESGSTAITSNVVDVLDGVATDNISDNNYTVFGSTTQTYLKSYLMENTDGTLTRVEYVEDTGVVVETYSAPGSPDSTLILEAELSIFGGFYAGEEYNFLVFGQNNSEESDEAEVLRIVKYDKDWNRVSSCSVYGANTYVPFDSGSLRMTETAGSLYIHTCHEMYASGTTHHQANMTFVMDISSMEITDSWYGVMNISYGYVSHSFNQFIQTDGETIYRVDHGDAYPRGVALTAVSVGDTITSVVNYTTVLDIQGTSGANATGVSVGGFELSTGNCLIVGNSVDQSDADTYDASGRRNIFLTVTDKSLTNTETIWLTDYTDEDNVMPRTPQLVKLSDDRFLILWEEYETDTMAVTTKIVLIDGNGTMLSDVVSTYLRLSDCQPIYTSSGTVTWYVTSSAVTLYTIDPYDLESLAEENLSGACGPNAMYELDLETGVLTISGTGAMADWNYASDVGFWYTPWYPYRDQITSVVIQEGITSIGVNTFYNCSNLTSITIPNSVTSIGNSAFSGCNGISVSYGGTLENWFAISMGNSTSDPLYNSGLLCIEGYSAITALGICGNELYYYFTEDGTLTICGTGAMSQWSSYLSVPWYSYRTQITSAVIEEGITEISNYAFYDCSSLANVTLAESVTSLGNYAFWNCTGLSQIALFGVSSIGSYAFYGCANLAEIALSDGLTDVGNNAFYNCSSLTEITLPSSIASIGTYVFTGTSLEAVYYQGTLEEWFAISTSSNPISNSCKLYLDGYDGIIKWGDLGDELHYILTETGALTIWGSGTLDEMMFYDGTWMPYYELVTSVVIEEGVTEISEFGFSDFAKMEKIYLPSSLTAIGAYSFTQYADGFTIYGYQGSYAQTYAKQNNIPFVALDASPYDLNSDGIVDLLDVMTLAQCVAGIDNGVTAIDLDGNNVIDVRDVMCLAQMIVNS